MKCRKNCGACCIVPSISTVIPDTKKPKKANVRCIHLSQDNECLIFDRPDRPEVCEKFLAEIEFCGSSREEAIEILQSLL